MARALWNGTISFGLVNVPVKAFTATRDHKVHFRELDPNGGRIRHEKVSARTGKVVDDIRLGFETSKGHYVRFTSRELDALRPRSTRAIEVTDFVELAEIDPIFYARTYWLAAADDEARAAYALLRDAMEDRQMVAIGTVVIRRTQYLAAVRPVEGALALSTMRFADEVVPSSAVDNIPTRATRAKPKELALAGQIIDALAADWRPENYHDTYTDELRRLIRRRAKGGREQVEEEPEEATGEVVDLMAALEASLKEGRSGRRKAGGRGRGPARKRAARRSA
jgi:DNA end-binding protein Ku